MNLDELRGALQELAGPPPLPTRSTRAAVTRRVGHARRRVGVAAGALALAAALAVFFVVRSAAVDAPSGRVVVAAGSSSCRQLPRRVPRAQVPAAVRRWAGRAPVVGGGSLWTVRRLLNGDAAHDPPVWRMKIGWFVVPTGPGTTAPTLTARELDGPGRATGSAGPATDASGTWFASTIEVPESSGCWEITARHGDDVIRFRRTPGPRH